LKLAAVKSYLKLEEPVLERLFVRFCPRITLHI
jgi:hypothetical protein